MAEAWLIGIALFFILEGIGPLLFPNRWRDYISKLANLPPAQLRSFGLGAVVAGAVILFSQR